MLPLILPPETQRERQAATRVRLRRRRAAPSSSVVRARQRSFTITNIGIELYRIAASMHSRRSMLDVFSHANLNFQ